MRGVTEKEKKVIERYFQEEIKKEKKINAYQLDYFFYFAPLIGRFPSESFSFLQNRFRELKNFIAERNFFQIDRDVQLDDRGYLKEQFEKFIESVSLSYKKRKKQKEGKEDRKEPLLIKKIKSKQERYVWNTDYMEFVKEVNKKNLDENCPGYVSNINYLWFISYFVNQKPGRDRFEKAIELMENSNWNLIKELKAEDETAKFLTKIGEVSLEIWCNYKLSFKALKLLWDTKLNHKIKKFPHLLGKLFLCTVNKEITYDMLKNSKPFYIALWELLHNDFFSINNEYSIYFKKYIELCQEVIKLSIFEKSDKDIGVLIDHSNYKEIMKRINDFWENINIVSINNEELVEEVIFTCFMLDILLTLLRWRKDVQKFKMLLNITDILAIIYYTVKDQLNNKHQKLLWEWFKYKLIFFLYYLLEIYEHNNYELDEEKKIILKNLKDIVGHGDLNWNSKDFYPAIVEISRDFQQFLDFTDNNFLLISILWNYSLILPLEKQGYFLRLIKKMEEDFDISFYSLLSYWKLLKLYWDKIDLKTVMLKQLFNLAKKFKYSPSTLKTILEVLLYNLNYLGSDETIKYFQEYKSLIGDINKLPIKEQIDFINKFILYEIQHITSLDEKLRGIEETRQFLSNLPFSKLNEKEKLTILDNQIIIELLEYDVRKLKGDKESRNILDGIWDRFITVCYAIGILQSKVILPILVSKEKAMSVLVRSYSIIKSYISEYGLEGGKIEEIIDYFFINNPIHEFPDYEHAAFNVAIHLFNRRNFDKVVPILKNLLRKELTLEMRVESLNILKMLSYDEEERRMLENEIKQLEISLIDSFKEIEDLNTLLIYTRYLTLGEFLKMGKSKQDIWLSIYRLKKDNKLDECKKILKKWFAEDFSINNATYNDLELLETLRKMLNKREKLFPEVVKYITKTKIKLALNNLRLLKEKFKDNKNLIEILENVEEDIKKGVIKL